MKATLLGGLVVWTFLTAGLTMADTIQTTYGSFQSFPILTQGVGNTVYWDNASIDGPNKGIGYFIKGQSGDAFSPNYSNPYWFQGTGQQGSPSSILFNSTGIVTVTVLLHTTGNSLEFGYFDANTPGTTVKLFDTNTALGTSIQLTLPATYGLYLHYIPPTNGTDYYKSAVVNSLSTESVTHQHFSAFTPNIGSGTFIIGAEDQWGITSLGNVNENLGDFNDFVVAITAVPEPSTYALIGIGLAGVMSLRRRRS